MSLKSSTPYRNKLIKLCEELAIHITAFNPQYISKEDVPEGVKVDKEDILFEQDFEGGKSFGEFLARSIKKDFRKEPIQISSFYRFSIGDYIEEENIQLSKSEHKDSFGY